MSFAAVAVAWTGERMPAGHEWYDEGLVFAQANGRPIDKDRLRRLGAATSAGRRPARPAARRSAPAPERERAPPVVREPLGHNQMRPAMDIYRGTGITRTLSGTLGTLSPNHRCPIEADLP
jgi:hypothetical protein